ncbi:MAG: type II toxin-antitoxin system VapC family toxin [bacterium]
MAYLLDTCVALWFFEGSANIPVPVRNVLTDPSEDLLLSDVSILEIVIKYRLGKLPLDAAPSRIILPLARKHSIDILPLSTSAIFQLEGLKDFHRDPFDRLLVAQALAHQMTLVTPDPLIRQYPVHSLWD